MDLASFVLFFVAALVIAVSPGPGIFYVAARTLAGGRREGLASSFGTGLGGLVHVAAGAVGVSALVLASAEGFTLLKIAGAAYLVWLGIKTVREARVAIDMRAEPTARGAPSAKASSSRRSIPRPQPSSWPSCRSSSTRRPARCGCSSCCSGLSR